MGNANSIQRLRNIFRSSDGDNIAFLQNSPVAVLFGNDSQRCCPTPEKKGPFDGYGTLSISVPGLDQPTAPWIPNLEPRRLVNLVYCDPDGPALLRKKRRALLGMKISPVCDDCHNGQFVRSFVDLPCWKRWYIKNKHWYDKYMRQRTVNKVFFSMMYTLGRHKPGNGRTRAFGEIDRFENIDATNVLAVQLKEGEMEPSKFVVISRREHKIHYTILPAFDWDNPRKHGMWIHQTKDHIPGELHYAYPDYISAAPMMELRQNIHRLHNSGLQNGWNVKYVTTIPVDLVERIFEAKCKSLKANEKRPTYDQVRQEILWDLENRLAGVDNNQATVVTYSMMVDGKEVKMTLEPLENHFKGDQYIKLAEFINRNLNLPFDNSSVLSGKNNEEKVGGTGSEVFRFQNIENTINSYDDRRMILEINDLLTHVNNWRDKVPASMNHFEWDFFAPNMTTLDIARTGESSPNDPVTSNLNPNA